MVKRWCFILLVILTLPACGPVLLKETVAASPTTVSAAPPPPATLVSTPVPTATFMPIPVLTVTPTQTLMPEISAQALSFLNQAVQIMQTNALNRSQVDWIKLQEQVNVQAGSAQTPADTYQAIQYALNSMGDGYSLLIPADQVQLLLQGKLAGSQQMAQGNSLEAGRIGYLQLPGIQGSVQAEEAYAIELQRLIVELDASRPCGWVVDLRQTSSGNIWALLAGIGPVLGEGLAGSFVYPDGSQRLIYYAMGRSLLGDEVQLGIENHISYQLSEYIPLAAVLTGPGTINSGEILTITFRGRDKSRTFGQNTAGLVNATQTFVLSDGSWIVMAVALITDRQGKLYDGPIQPDEFIAATAGNDMVLRTAIDWLLRQPDCTTGSN